MTLNLIFYQIFLAYFFIIFIKLIEYRKLIIIINLKIKFLFILTNHFLFIVLQDFINIYFLTSHFLIIIIR